MSLIKGQFSESEPVSKTDIDDDVLKLELRNQEKAEFKLNEISDFSLVEDYSIITRLDLLVQALYSISAGLTIGWLSLVLFVGVSVGSPEQVMSSLLNNYVLLFFVLFVGGIATTSVLFLYYYREIRETLLLRYTPDASVIKFDYEGDTFEFRNIPDEKASSISEQLP